MYDHVLRTASDETCCTAACIRVQLVHNDACSDWRVHTHAFPETGRTHLKPTDISNPDYLHKVVDCQWACPAHTPVPEYIRQIAAGDFSTAYMINWRSNVFPGILGRVCDRPCEPACRRGRVDAEPVAICRLKRVAADFKDDIRDRLPRPPEKKNGKRIACIGGGPASLTVARDLAVQGYQVTVFDSGSSSGGMMRSQIPKFRLPDSVIDEECGYVEHLASNCARTTGSAACARCWRATGTPSSSAPAPPAGATPTCRGATRPRRTSTSASTGSRASPSVTSPRSASA